MMNTIRSIQKFMHEKFADDYTFTGCGAEGCFSFGLHDDDARLSFLKVSVSYEGRVEVASNSQEQRNKLIIAFDPIKEEDLPNLFSSIESSVTAYESEKRKNSEKPKEEVKGMIASGTVFLETIRAFINKKFGDIYETAIEEDDDVNSVTIGISDPENDEESILHAILELSDGIVTEIRIFRNEGRKLIYKSVVGDAFPMENMLNVIVEELDRYNYENKKKAKKYPNETIFDELVTFAENTFLGKDGLDIYVEGLKLQIIDKNGKVILEVIVGNVIEIIWTGVEDGEKRLKEYPLEEESVDKACEVMKIIVSAHNLEKKNEENDLVPLVQSVAEIRLAEELKHEYRGRYTILENPFRETLVIEIAKDKVSLMKIVFPAIEKRIDVYTLYPGENVISFQRTERGIQRILELVRAQLKRFENEEEELNEFSVLSSCVKCRSNGIHKTEYRKEGNNEFLLRTCVRCGYEWKERVLG